MYLALWFFVILFIYAIFMVVKFSKKRKLSNQEIAQLKILLQRIQRWVSTKEKIVDMDKLYHKILKQLWYTGTFWEILKAQPNEIWDIQKIWELHKLRNKLVHEFDNHGEKYLRQADKDYKKQIQVLLANIK